MIVWHFSRQDQNIVFLIKTTKKKYLRDIVEKGRFCFNLPTVFNIGDNLASAQKDKWDSYTFHNAFHICFAPIISEGDYGIQYGKVQKLVDEARIHSITPTAKHTPLCSFRRVDPSEVTHRFGAYFFKLGDVVDRIKNELGHDSFVLIYQPTLFLDRLQEKTTYFARSVHYGDMDSDFESFLYNSGFEQAEMFQKEASFQWQKEFRIILPPIETEEKVILEIGSIEDIAICGDIEQLRNVFVFCKDEKHVKEVQQILTDNNMTPEDMFNSEQGEPQ